MSGDGDSIQIGEYLIPSDPADLTICDGCQ